jgi:Holliday junction resolvase
MSEKKKTYNNYLKGRRKEYQIIKQLKTEGWTIVTRSAGSHSPIDIFAIKEGEILFIQSKPKNFSKKHIELLKSKYCWMNSNFKGRFEVR